MVEADRSQQKDKRQVRSRILKNDLKNDSSCLITDGSSALADYTAQREKLSILRLLYRNLIIRPDILERQRPGLARPAASLTRSRGEH